MNILVIGSRYFTQGYRVDRALQNAVDHFDPHCREDLSVYTHGHRRRGADRLARHYADDHGWDLFDIDCEYGEGVSVEPGSMAVCLAFLTDEPDELAMKGLRRAKRAGIPIWTYRQTNSSRPPEVSPTPADLTEVERQIEELRQEHRLVAAGDYDYYVVTHPAGSPF